MHHDRPPEKYRSSRDNAWGCVARKCNATPACGTAFSTRAGSLLSLTEHWRENSYGATTAIGDVAPGTSGGWYTLDQVYDDTQRSQIRAAAISAADPDVDFTQYSRVFLIINGMTITTNYAGFGTIGCGPLSSNDGNFIASTSWIREHLHLPIMSGVPFWLFMKPATILDYNTPTLETSIRKRWERQALPALLKNIAMSSRRWAVASATMPLHTNSNSGG